MMKKTLTLDEIQINTIEAALGARMGVIRDAIEAEKGQPCEGWSDEDHEARDARVARMGLTLKQTLEAAEAIRKAEPV